MSFTRGQDIDRSRRGRDTAVVAVVWLAMAIGAGAPAADRDQVSDEVNSQLAVIDSLMAVDAAEALSRAYALHRRTEGDPLYGWQVEGRLALALLANERFEEALPLLENQVRVQPTDPGAHRNLASALRSLGKRGRALTEYGLVVELDPYDFRSHLEYGQYLLTFRSFAKAVYHLQEARRLCDGCVEADRALANAHLAAGDFASATDPLRRLVEVDADPGVQRSLLAALARSGQDRELIERLLHEEAERMDAEELRLLVDAEGRLGLADQSLAIVGHGSMTAGKNLDAGFWGQVALNLLETGHFTEGLAASDRALALDPSSVVLRTNRVVLLQKLGRDVEARREWTKLQEQSDGSDQDGERKESR